MTPLVIAALAFGGLATVGTAAIVLASPAKGDKGTGGKLGGATFNGKAYSDASISEGELAEAASHGDKEASDELGRRESRRRVEGWCSELGVKEECKPYLDEAMKIVEVLQKAVGDDLADAANTPEQKARLAKAVAKIVSLGFPPTKFTSLLEFGVQEQADVIESDIKVITTGPKYTCPFIGTIDMSGELTDIGQSAVYTAGLDSPVMTQLNSIFGGVAARRTTDGCVYQERTINLFDHPPTRANLRMWPDPNSASVNEFHPMLAYVAYAGAGRYGMPVDKAIDAVIANAASFCDRHGIMSQADALGGSDPDRKEFIPGFLVTNGGPLILAEAWFGLRTYAQKNGFKRAALRTPPPYAKLSNTSKISGLTVAGCSSCTRPFMPRTNGFFT